MTEEEEQRKKDLVGEVIDIYINSLTPEEIKDQFIKNLEFDISWNSHFYLVEVIEKKFGESIESIYERTNGGIK